MSGGKKNGNYTIVYVYGPTRCKKAYFENSVLNRENGEFVKIGKTDYTGKLDDLSEEKLKQEAIKRYASPKTGNPDWCDIYQTFIFPKSNQNIDDVIRNILCNDIYNLANSKDEKKEKKGDIEPGREFVYGVSRNHIKHAIESYSFSLFAHADKADLEMLQKMAEYNAMMNEDDEEDGAQDNTPLKKRQKGSNRDINMVLSPGDVVFLTNARDGNNEVKDADGKRIEATYVGNKRFRYQNDDPKFGSKLALELIAKYCGMPYETINGNACWFVEYVDENGETFSASLADRYDAIINK